MKAEEKIVKLQDLYLRGEIDLDEYTIKIIEFAQQQKPRSSEVELPTDEQIEKWVNEHGYYGHCTTEYHEGLEEGAKWMRSKSTNQKQIR